MRMRFLITGFAAILIVLSSCGDYNKIVKSTDYDFKYKKAIEYYDDGEYVKAATLLHDLVNIYRGTTRADKIYYYYAKSMLGQKDYLMAGHYFKSLVKEFPNSEYAEESQFMIGYCAYLLSPKPRLDQQLTKDAIDALQLFVNLYPFSDRIEEATRLIGEMENKLVLKSYLSAKMYYDFEKYKAAVVALGNSLTQFPDSKYREDLKYMLLKSKYLLAEKSIQDKQEIRYTNALDEYFSFINEFPDTKYKKEVTKFYEKASSATNYKEEELNLN